MESVSDGAGGNGAGIRYQSLNMTVNRCKFEYCQDGILEGGNYTNSTVIIENCEFSHNGYNGTDNSLVGYEHQMYISAQTDSLVVENCYIHDVRGEGHSLKTRAQKSYILYNLIDEALGNGSYETDIAQGGLVAMVGNVIITGTNDANHVMICLEAVTNPLEEIYIVNNTIINKYASTAKFINIIPSSGVTVFKIYNNIFASVTTASSSIFNGNTPSVIDTAKNIFIKNFAAYGFVNAALDNYNLLSTAIGAIDKGAAAGVTSTGFSLTPLYMFQSDSLALLPRTVVGSAIDIGAYEYEGNVGINQLRKTNYELRIFPNPVVKASIISFQSSINGNVTVKIFDNTGKIVKTISGTFQNGCITIKREGLQTGMYYYVITGNDEVLVGKGKMLVL